jgi:hypothetical protein
LANALKDAYTELIQPIKFGDFNTDAFGVHENEDIFQIILGYRALIICLERRAKMASELTTVGAGNYRPDIVLSKDTVGTIYETKHDRATKPNTDTGRKAAIDGLEQVENFKELSHSILLEF